MRNYVLICLGAGGFREGDNYDESSIHLPRQLEWKVVGMLELLGLREILEQEITTI